MPRSLSRVSLNKNYRLSFIVLALIAHNSLPKICTHLSHKCHLCAIKNERRFILQPLLFGLNVLNLHQIRDYGLYIWNFIYYFVNK